MKSNEAVALFFLGVGVILIVGGVLELSSGNGFGYAGVWIGVIWAITGLIVLSDKITALAVSVKREDPFELGVKTGKKILEKMQEHKPKEDVKEISKFIETPYGRIWTSLYYDKYIGLWVVSVEKHPHANEYYRYRFMRYTSALNFYKGIVSTLEGRKGGNEDKA